MDGQEETREARGGSQGNAWGQDQSPAIIGGASWREKLCVGARQGGQGKSWCIGHDISHYHPSLLSSFVIISKFCWMMLLAIGQCGREGTGKERGPSEQEREQRAGEGGKRETGGRDGYANQEEGS